MIFYFSTPILGSAFTASTEATPACGRALSRGGAGWSLCRRRRRRISHFICDSRRTHNSCVCRNVGTP